MEDDMFQMKRKEQMMVKWMCSVCLTNRVTSKDMKRHLVYVDGDADVVTHVGLM